MAVGSRGSRVLRFGFGSDAQGLLRDFARSFSVLVPTCTSGSLPPAPVAQKGPGFLIFTQASGSFCKRGSHHIEKTSSTK